MGIELARTATRLAAGMYDVIGRLAECLLAPKANADVIGNWPYIVVLASLKASADVICQMWPER